jgi:hypothetical protein
MPSHSSGRTKRTRRARPSEKTTFRVISGFPPLGHLALDGPSPWRGGLRTPAKMAWVQPRHVPARQPAVRQLVRDDDVPRLAHGLATRARRPRPSEKTALRLSPGPFPRGLSPGACPRGGAGSARPWRRHNAKPECCLVSATSLSQNHRWQRNAFPFVRPYQTDAQSASLRENHLSRHIRVSPARPSCPGWALPAEGRALHARKEGTGLTEACAR